jgi:DNA-binding transcriptional regulator YhcF (GntR family)
VAGRLFVIHDRGRALFTKEKGQNTHDENLQNISKFSEKGVDKYTSLKYNNTRKAEENLLRKEVRNLEEMTSRQTVRLIEWLRAQGFTEEQIVQCIEHINK